MPACPQDPEIQAQSEISGARGQVATRRASKRSCQQPLGL